MQRTAVSRISMTLPINRKLEMPNRTRTATALLLATLMYLGPGSMGASGQVSQESMKTLRVEKVRFEVPRGEIRVMQGQPMFISLCQAAALPGVPVSLTNPSRLNSMMGAGVCGMTNMPGATNNPTGGNPPYHFDTEFSFPPFGLQLNNTTGFLSGRPTQPGNYRFNVCAYDASGNKSVCQDMRIRVLKKEDKKKKRDSKDQSADNQNAFAGEPIDATPAFDQWKSGESTGVKSSSGPSKGRIIGAVAAGTGAGVAGLMVGDYMSKQALEEAGLGSSSGGSSGGSGSGGGMTFVGGSFNCTYNAGGVVSSCANSSITVNITMKFAAGSRLKLATDSISSLDLFTTTASAPGNVTFRTFSGGGWFDRCGPAQTRLLLVNTSVSTSAVASVSGLSVPITCR
jgi:hypothetical protein